MSHLILFSSNFVGVTCLPKEGCAYLSITIIGAEESRVSGRRAHMLQAFSQSRCACSVLWKQIRQLNLESNVAAAKPIGKAEMSHFG